jgi:hypothetical protein
MVSVASSLREVRTVLKSRIHSRSCRIHFHGWDQSSNTTINVFGIDWGVRSGWRREAKAAEGLVRV